MAQGQAAKILFSRSLVRRTGESFETSTLKVEANLPASSSRQEFLTDLEATISSILSKSSDIATGLATVTTPTCEHPAPRPVQGEFSKTRQNAAEINNISSALEGVTQAQVSFEENTLTVSVSEDLKLRYDSGPIQSFLIPRILDTMQRLGELNYKFDVTRDGYLSGIHIEFPSGLADATVLRRIKRITSPISWTLRALSER
jgi:hypothetical protein